MSTGLMSCVRENTPPLDSSEMQAEVSTMSLPSEYSAEPQKRRRFNALKNLRRIFRRRTVASAETLPSKGKIRSHIAPVELLEDNDHFRGSFGAYKQPPSARSSTTQQHQHQQDRGYDSTRTRSTTLDYAAAHGYSVSGGSRSNHQHRNGGRRHVEDYSFDECSRRRERHSQIPLSPVGPLDRVSVHVNEQYTPGGSADWTNGAHKRSHSEDRLKEGVPLDQELSKSHESVFREPGDMAAMLTIGLKTELIDVLRKRRSRSDAFDAANLETQAQSPKRSSAEMYDLRNTLPSRKVVADAEAQVRLVEAAAATADVTDLAPLSHNHLKTQLSSSSKDSDVVPIAGQLSHSAARHKLAIRPKKKGPSRFRRSVENSTTTTNETGESSSSPSAATVVTHNKEENNDQSTDDTLKQLIVPSPRKISIDLPAKPIITTLSTSSNSSGSAFERPSMPRIIPERPKSMMMPFSSSTSTQAGVVGSQSPPKSHYFEGLRPAYRNSTSHNSLLSKSEEHLQEPESVKFGDLGYNNTTKAASPCINRISSGRRRSVEKSQSFKIFPNSASSGTTTNAPVVINGNNHKGGGIVDNIADRRELFHLNRPVSYKEFTKPIIIPRSIPDRSPTRPPQPLPIVVDTNNIVQIEENIDKLVSSPFVPVAPFVLKKPIEPTEVTHVRKAVNNNNVSITAIRPSVDVQSSVSTSSSSEESSPVKSSVVNLRRRSSTKIEKSPSVGSLNTLGAAAEESKLPEFMRIHLNRVENTRPKSSSVLYRGTSDTLPRRFSREFDSNKPPLPPVLNVSTLKRPSINKSQETITESNHVIVVVPNTVVMSPRKASIEKQEAVVTTTTTSGIIQAIKTPLSPILIAGNAAPLSPVIVPESPKNVTPPTVTQMAAKPEPVIMRDELLSERKGSVSEEKAKIERRLSIVDDKNFMRKKSLPNSTTSPQLNGGGKGSKKEDNTPELMKVFARRSMKLKDDDDEPHVVQKSDSRSSVITDSDKENQSSSREELSPKSKEIEDDLPPVIREQQSKARGGEVPVAYRPRTFMEVKNMLQSTNGNGNSNTNNNNHKSIGLLRSQKPATVLPISEVLVKKEPSTQKSPRNSTGEHINSDADLLPEFKRIVERREEWESRAKMWK